jgi:hypothetical protein
MFPPTLPPINAIIGGKKGEGGRRKPIGKMAEWLIVRIRGATINETQTSAKPMLLKPP